MSDDAEIEYDRLFSSLDRQKIMAFAQHSASMYGLRPRFGKANPLDTGKATHLMAVGGLAIKYVDLMHIDADALERRYHSRVCEAAGFLHETMAQACSFEEIVEMSDEAVANIVAAVTPDLREPAPKRMKLLANKVGLAGKNAQLVMLADLRHEAARYAKAATQVPEQTSEWLDGAFAVIGSLRLVTETPLLARVKALRDELTVISKQIVIKR